MARSESVLLRFPFHFIPYILHPILYNKSYSVLSLIAHNRHMIYLVERTTDLCQQERQDLHLLTRQSLMREWNLGSNTAEDMPSVQTVITNALGTAVVVVNEFLRVPTDHAASVRLTLKYFLATHFRSCPLFVQVCLAFLFAKDFYSQ